MLKLNVNGDAKSKKEGERSGNVLRSQQDKLQDVDENDLIFHDRYIIK